MTKRVQKIGEIGVDAGLCWIGDPSYILHTQPAPKAIGQDWEDFCRELCDSDGGPLLSRQFNYDLGHAGLGVVVTTGYGDGVYPVYVEHSDDGRIARVWVEFIGDNEACGIEGDDEEQADSELEGDDEEDDMALATIAEATSGAKASAPEADNVLDFEGERLRRAAPKLLEALQAASEWIDARIGVPRIEIQAKIQQAIAEATG